MTVLKNATTPAIVALFLCVSASPFAFAQSAKLVATYRQLLGYEPGTPADKMDSKAKIDVSPISFASS